MKGNLSDFTLKAKNTCKNVLKEYRSDVELALGQSKVNLKDNTRAIKRDESEMSR